MIRLSEELAVQIEQGALESLEKYKEWHLFSKEQLYAQLHKYTSQLGKWDGLPEEFLEGSSAFIELCVRLACVRTLLNGKSFYR